MKFRPRTDREGVALAVVAVMMVGLLAILSLAIDLGMAYTARAEAQRVADAAALAGASAFVDIVNPYEAEPTARSRAADYVARNYVRNDPVDPASQSQIEILPAEEKVRVWVWKEGLGTWFARFIGVNQIRIGAVAAAQARAAGASRCLKPWAVMDWWNDLNQDLNGDKIPNEDEHWVFEPETDQYVPISGPEDTQGTGLGGQFRNDLSHDYGRQIVIKAQKPSQVTLPDGTKVQSYVPESGLFMPIELPPSEGQETCFAGGGGTEQGAATYYNNICGCNTDVYAIGDSVEVKPGNMPQQTGLQVQKLIDADQTASFMETAGGGIFSSPYGLESPRVIRLAFIAPGDILKSGSQYVTFVNFGLFFLEGLTTVGGLEVVSGRFLQFVPGDEGGENASPNIKMVRLVE